MGLSLSEQYFLKAVDEYPYDLEEVFRNIELALTQDKRHAGALCLLARTYYEQLQRFEEADRYFRKALSASPAYAQTYLYFIDFLLECGETDEAEKFLALARKCKGIGRAKLHHWQALIWELRGHYQKAEEALGEAQRQTTDSHYFNLLDEERSRVKRKQQNSRKPYYVWRE